MEQTKALNALEPFLALQKTASSPPAAAELITRATSAPHTYIFAELLHTPSIQSLVTTPHAPSLTLLQIFSHGTYADYLSTPNLPALNDKQALKLRQLSLLSLARDRQNLGYDGLVSALGLQTAQELEGVVTEAVYAGLLDATMDPHRAVLQVHSVAPLRDLAPGAVSPMMERLAGWSDRCDETLSSLEAEIEGIKERARVRQREKERAEEELQSLLDAKDPAEGMSALERRARGGGRTRWGSKRGVGEGDEAMDVDVDEGGSKVRASRRKL